MANSATSSAKELYQEPPFGTMGNRRLNVEIGVGVALSFVLGFFSLVPFPAGGQVSLDMVPILLLARLRGLRSGMLAGVVYGLLHIVQEPILFHPVQVLLDYPIAFGLLGLAGLFPTHATTASLAHSKQSLASRCRDLAAIVLGVTARYAAHCLSGVIFIGLFLPSDKLPASPLAWSLTYNATFLLPSALICLLLVPILVQVLRDRLSGYGTYK